VKKNLRSFITSSFFALFLGYFALITFFSHPHVIDGKIAFHAHPFQKSNPDHTHTKAEFLFYHTSSSVEVNTITYNFDLDLSCFTFDIHYLIFIGENFPFTYEYAVYSLRGPPSCC